MEKKNTHIMYGFITGLAYIIVSLVLYVMGLSFEPWAPYVTYLPFLAGIILNALAYSKANDHYVTFGNVFSSGFKASAIITLMLLVWSFISLWVFPEMKEKAIEMASERMSSQNMSEEQIDQTMEMTKKYMTLFMVMGVVFGTMFFGLIFSLLGAAIAKKKGNTPPPQVL
jgi:hypothetical protein